ncbi:MAG: hypothetical protein KC657_05975 [Myxococcales bacterium]|nr:hypothetical protein [Myxococcales bacterium]
MRTWLGIALGAAIVVGCSASEQRSGFNQEDPAGGAGGISSGGFGTSSSSGGPVDPKECAKAQAVATRPPVDVIVSVDQSGSMSDDIANVKANINKLSDFLQKTGLDYRVVMIGTPGTGSYDICVPPPLGGPSCTSNGNTFRVVNRNVQSSDTLSIIISTLQQTSGAMEWKSFLRPSALKIFIPITDDNSYIKATAFDPDLLTKGQGLFGSATDRRYVFYPITGAAAFPSESTCGSNAVNNGKEYLELAKLTKGRWFPICLKDFAPVFEEIARNVAVTVACELDVPKPAGGGEIDFDRVNVSIAPSNGGASRDVLQDASKPCDGGADGWQYNTDRTKIRLCGAACDGVRADVGTKVTVEFGCQTRVK